MHLTINNEVVAFVDGKKIKGKIQFIFPGEIYDVQLELENPDQDGHRITRISRFDIVPTTQEVQPKKQELYDIRVSDKTTGQLGFFV